jgi:penicillin-binding protein-related factor A (putative recombinase)
LSSRKEGNAFEDAFEDSCKKLKIFFSRNRDVFIPPDLRQRIRVPKNLYDYFMFANKTLFPLELKSTKENNLPFKNIKEHQLKALEDASKFEDTISGILINFRHEFNKCYFIHVKDFLQYQKVAEGKAENTYANKVNKSSISKGICQEIGIEVGSIIKKVNYHYHVKDFIREAIQKYTA